ncbi:hypothetical protein LTR17_013782 [Elasticomyces elasticus]|nr:hypothetical protein LTR17_013782 [Elasticomyces elasticus]
MDTIKHILVYLIQTVRLAYRRMLPKSYFRAASAANSNTSLLRLPRELRDMIYEHATCDICISVARSPLRHGRSREIQQIWLEGTSCPSLLLTCRQTHDECKETVRPVINIDGLKHLPDQDLVHGAFKYVLKPTLPWDALHSVKHCYMRLDWYAVLSQGSDYFAWQRALTSGDPYPSNWTPARALRRRLERFMNDMWDRVGYDTGVTICFQLDEFPDDADPYRVGIFPSWMTGGGIGRAAFDIETLWSMETDRILGWPQPSKLQVEGALSTPLYLEWPENLVEVQASYEAWRRGEIQKDAVIQPIAKASQETVTWRLRPLGGENTWNGFMPEFATVEEG